MKFSIVLLVAIFAVAAVASAVPELKDAEYEFVFSKWSQQHGKTYSSPSEKARRMAIFKDNLNYIRKHQANPERTHELSMNKFGDMTNDEFAAKFNGYVNINKSYLRSKNYAAFDASKKLPTSVDWYAAGKVTPVKNQEQCGSCWAFSTTGSTEAAYAIENNASPISLSEQQLVDCAQAEGNQGCEGGLMDQGFQYIMDDKGLCTEQAYPYTAQDGTCQASTCTNAVTISGYQDVTANNSIALQTAVAQQPVSVAVDASGSDWQFYSGGVLSDACGTELDHGVLATGYGVSGSTPYWIVKNSWGTDWGKAGFILLKRDSSTSSPGECGINMVASYPTGATKVGSKKNKKIFHRRV